jgi:hypothetical protein
VSFADTDPTELLVAWRPLSHSLRMTFLASWRTKRQRERAAHAEERAFVSDYQRQPKNRPSQILLSLGIGTTLVGASFGASGSRLGLYVGLPALLATVAIAWWIFRKWDY